MNEWYKLQRHEKASDLIVLSTLSSSVSMLRAFIIFYENFVTHSNPNMMKHAPIWWSCVRLQYSWMNSRSWRWGCVFPGETIKNGEILCCKLFRVDHVLAIEKLITKMRCSCATVFRASGRVRTWISENDNNQDLLGVICLRHWQFTERSHTATRNGWARWIRRRFMWCLLPLFVVNKFQIN